MDGDEFNRRGAKEGGEGEGQEDRRSTVEVFGKKEGKIVDLRGSVAQPASDGIALGATSLYLYDCGCW